MVQLATSTQRSSPASAVSASPHFPQRGTCNSTLQRILQRLVEVLSSLPSTSSSRFSNKPMICIWLPGLLASHLASLSSPLAATDRVLATTSAVSSVVPAAAAQRDELRVACSRSEP